MAKQIMTADDWERELQNPQSPLYKLLMAQLAKKLDAEACFEALLQYWVQKMQLADKHERHRSWETHELSQEALLRDAVSSSFMPAKALPNEIKPLLELQAALAETQDNLQAQAMVLQNRLADHEQTMAAINQAWDARQQVNTQQLLTELQTHFVSSTVLGPTGEPIPPPPPSVWNKLETHLKHAIQRPAPEKLCEVNPDLIHREAKTAMHFSDVMAELRMKAALLCHLPALSSAHADHEDGFATTCLNFIKHNQAHPLPVPHHDALDEAAFVNAQQTIKASQTDKEALSVIHEKMQVLGARQAEVQAALRECGVSPPRPH